jgi:hypothetical protein
MQAITSYKCAQHLVSQVLIYIISLYRNEARNDHVSVWVSCSGGSEGMNDIAPSIPYDLSRAFDFPSVTSQPTSQNAVVESTSIVGTIEAINLRKTTR